MLGQLWALEVDEREAVSVRIEVPQRADDQVMAVLGRRCERSRVTARGRSATIVGGPIAANSFLVRSSDEPLRKASGGGRADR